MRIASALEFEAFNVRVKLVEPGLQPYDALHEQRGITHGRADPRGVRSFRAAHLAAFAQPAAVATELDVAEVVWRVLRTMKLGSYDFQQVPTRWRWLSRDKRQWQPGAPATSTSMTCGAQSQITRLPTVG